MYHLLSCLGKILPLYRHFSDFKSHCRYSIAGAGYKFYPLSINRVGFFLSINRVKIRLFPSVFMRTYF